VSLRSGDTRKQHAGNEMREASPEHEGETGYSIPTTVEVAGALTVVCTALAHSRGMNDSEQNLTEKTCQVLLIVPDSRIAGRHRITLKVAGFDVRRIAEWNGNAFEFDPEVLIVQLPDNHGSAADVATRLRAKARFAPVILVGLSPSAAFENERREGRHSGFDDIFPIGVEPTILLSRVQQLLVNRPPLTPCVTNPSAA
jgi:hypothetical protein